MTSPKADFENPTNSFLIAKYIGAKCWDRRYRVNHHIQPRNLSEHNERAARGRPFWGMHGVPLEFHPDGMRAGVIMCTACCFCNRVRLARYRNSTDLTPEFRIPTPGTGGMLSFSHLYI